MKAPAGKRIPTSVITAAAMTALLLGGCGTITAPSDMAVPAQLTCINLPTPLVATEVKGLLKIVWLTRLERGPYISEREDAQGTYYRAPPGGIHIGRPEMKDKPPGPTTHQTADGGIFVPRDSATPASLYAYLQHSSAPVSVPPANADCSTATVVRDPVTKGVSVGEFAAAFGASGAAGGLAARAATPNSGVSYGQAAGVGAVGGLIGGAIVAAMINKDLGKIVPHAVKLDPQFTADLNKIARTAVPIKETALK